MHKPVLVREVIEYLNVGDNKVYVDATLGCGGYSKALLEAGKETTVLAFEIDIDAIKIASDVLSPFGSRIKIFNRSYVEMTAALSESNFGKVDGLVADFGVSSLQLDASGRGFSFRKNETLDMRMDKRMRISAYDVVNGFSEDELDEIFRNYGDERFARRISKKLVRERRTRNIATTDELSAIIRLCYPLGHHKVHPSTRVFQALRIFVNKEYENISGLLALLPDVLNHGGRGVMVSYHSGEDRLVKRSFSQNAKNGSYRLLTKSPVTPREEEIRDNPRSRSAKLRAIEKR